MDWLTTIQWHRVLGFQKSVFEIALRGTVVYLALFLLLRLVLRRESAAVGVTDLLVVVLIADAAQNAMADDYRSLPDGILLVAVIVGWAWLLDWLAFRFRAVERFVKPPKLPLMTDGKLDAANMRHELITEEDIRSQLRLQGIEDLGDVRVVYMEPDGRLSVLRHDGSQHGEPDKTVF
jgi:uncharacterized membrane protein YcaP (DUF421 family)